MNAQHRLVAAALVALFGRTLHDIMEFGRPASDWPLTALLPALLLAAAATKTLLGTRIVALIWGLLNLSGAVLTVLPMSWLPFEPDQTAKHYVAHVLYAAMQMPLVIHGSKAAMRTPRAAIRNGDG